MNDPSIPILLATAASLGIIHTITGPDHYVPFIAMARVGNWSIAKTLRVATLCGTAHVGSSILLGGLGVLFGWALTGLEWFESFRGELAGWLLLGFGLAYFIWGLRQAWRNRPHSHWHAHEGGVVHTHTHDHHDDHAHVHADGGARMTPWVLFTIFVFGPCEPLIPLLMYPASQHAWWAVALVAIVFGACTIATMLGTVAVGYYGLSAARFGPLARYSHAAAGLALLACGGMIQLGF